MIRKHVWFFCLLATGCGTDTLAPRPASLAARVGRDADRGACHGPRSRQFDFWVGRWTIAATGTGDPAGVSDVTKDLGGCVVEESFTAANGARGRSLNAFDRRDGLWYQTFVGVFGVNFRIRGVPAQSAAMLLEGRRASFAGSNPTRITWTSAADGRVRQLIENSFDGGQTYVPGFDGSYSRVDALPVMPELRPGICPNVGAFRQFDFALGDWEVRSRSGYLIGRSRIATDLDGCLVTERFSGRRGDSQLSYFFFDLGTGEWVRAFADSEGRHVELVGGPTPEGNFAFRASGAPGARVGNSWYPAADGSIEVAWTGPGAPQD
ncbi:MAG: hypothetical protein AB7L66_22235, partial [Gemmatimonadales bacterium]